MAKINQIKKPSNRRATSYDVARLAGVSQSAVSRCFKDGGSVSKKMRDRVMKAVDELGYQPNAIARGLITRRSNMVGVIVASLGSYPEVLSELSQRFMKQGVHVLLFTLNSESDVGRILHEIWGYQLDGVVAAAHLSPEQIAEFDKRNVPLVFFNRSYSGQSVNSVCCNQEEGELALIELLTQDSSRQSFGIITGPSDSVVSQQRVMGARNELVRRGFSQIEEAAGDYSYESGQAALGKLIERSGTPDVVVCGNDMMAMGAIDYLRHRLGLKVPQDVAVVGFDGTVSATWDSYRLTTVKQPIESMAEAAVSMLMARVEAPDLPCETRVFSGVLIKGDTQ